MARVPLLERSTQTVRELGLGNAGNRPSQGLVRGDGRQCAYLLQELLWSPNQTKAVPAGVFWVPADICWVKELTGDTALQACVERAEKKGWTTAAAHPAPEVLCHRPTCNRRARSAASHACYQGRRDPTRRTSSWVDCPEEIGRVSTAAGFACDALSFFKYSGARCSAIRGLAVAANWARRQSFKEQDDTLGPTLVLIRDRRPQLE